MPAGRGWSAVLSTTVWPVFASRGGIGRSGHRRGPYIHPCCYEVSAGFYQQLLDQPGGDRVAAIASGCSTPFGPGQRSLKAAARGSDNLWFDLRAFAEAIAEAGVAPASVEWLGSCTYPRSRWAPTGAGPIFRRRRAFSIRGSCAKPEAARARAPENRGCRRGPADPPRPYSHSR